MESQKSIRVLSGIQPSGDLHLGNYFGAIAQFRKRQDQGDELFIFVADWHSLTTIKKADELRKNIRQIVAAYIAFGLDAGKTTLYRQSDIPEIQELSWILSCHATMGRLTNAHSFKDKQAKGISPTVGLFYYPVLMAADILCVQADVVPVGKDQKQHIEICQEIAEKFNRDYGKIFKVPKGVIPEDVAVVPGTDGQKMSKSYANTIDLFAPEKKLKKQVNSIVTAPLAQGDPMDPKTCNVFQLYKLIATSEEVETLAEKYRAGSIGFGHAKLALLDKIHETFGPARAEFEKLMADEKEIDRVLALGKEKAGAVIQQTVRDVRKKVGLD
ncbi:MAG: tryptophan--tRNA ligase [Candidatus Nitrohelix vancouverensis]|uniref:Tryptophan--tRNA ligase n=1 Tax=Candidatus Nitrohelix vancouverensis TaxID=2705534 RepID=A0A7T0C121_9BACT|nr:MAG: tryptophan--tRNA ligase [Candidatus Nitrohelix vancouverensis]